MICVTLSQRVPETRAARRQYLSGKGSLMRLFVRIFLVVAAALLALVVLAFVLKLLVIAAVIAALVVGGIIVVAAFRRHFLGRTAYPLRRL
jgi:hypothetical protein